MARHQAPSLWHNNRSNTNSHNIHHRHFPTHPSNGPIHLTVAPTQQLNDSGYHQTRSHLTRSRLTTHRAWGILVCRARFTAAIIMAHRQMEPHPAIPITTTIRTTRIPLTMQAIMPTTPLIPYNFRCRAVPPWHHPEQWDLRRSLPTNPQMSTT